jgi:hypothetical protein
MEKVELSNTETCRNVDFNFLFFQNFLQPKIVLHFA